MARPKGSTNKATEEKKLAKEQEMKQWETFATQSMVGNSIISTQRNKSYSKIDKDELDRMLMNPKGNALKLQDVSDYLESLNGVYSRLLQYFSSIITFDHEIIPKDSRSSLMDKTNFEQAYYKNCLYLEKMKIKHNLPYFAYKFFKYGELYLYNISDSKGIVYQEFENKYCRPYANENGVMSFVLDMLQINTNGNSIITYPTEIQRAYEIFKSKDGSKNNLFLDSRWYPVSNSGFCFVNSNNGGSSSPIFTNLFGDVLNIDVNKEMQVNKDAIDSTRMIHNRIPLTKTDVPILPPNIASKYNDAIADNLSKGLFCVTNPFDPQVLNLGDSSQRQNTLSEQAVTQFFDASGISSLLFNNPKSSSEALKKSVQTDLAMVVNKLIPMFENYVNRELGNVGGTTKFICKIFDFSIFNREDMRKLASAELATSGNVNLFMATVGYTPLQAMNSLLCNDLTGIRNLMKPLLTAHTATAEDLNGGAPKKETDISDSLEKSKENGTR